MKRFLSLLLCLLLVASIALPAFAASGDTTVYVTKTGECYHSAGCQYLAKSSIAKTLQGVINSGYRACSKCSPPKLTVAAAPVATPTPTPKPTATPKPLTSTTKKVTTTTSSYVSWDDYRAAKQQIALLEETREELEAAVSARETATWCVGLGLGLVAVVYRARFKRLSKRQKETAELIESSGVKNPYTGERIKTVDDFVSYCNRYHFDHHKSPHDEFQRKQDIPRP